MTERKKIQSFRDLIAWQKGMDLVCLCYDMTTQLPPEEKFGLIAQMRRCAISIPSNISEGWDRSTADYIRFLAMARGSTHELSTQSEICERLRYAGTWDGFVASCEEVGRIINGLIASLEKRRS